MSHDSNNHPNTSLNIGSLANAPLTVSPALPDRRLLISCEHKYNGPRTAETLPVSQTRLPYLNLHSDAQWLQQHALPSDSQSRSLQANDLDDYGLQSVSPWFPSNGFHDITSFEWTPESLLDFNAVDGNEATLATTAASPLVSKTNLQYPTSAVIEEDIIDSSVLHCDGIMPTTADFFGLDIGSGYGPSLEVSQEVLNRAQENLRKWTDISSSAASTSTLSTTSPDDSCQFDLLSQLTATPPNSQQMSSNVTAPRSEQQNSRASSPEESTTKMGVLHKSQGTAPSKVQKTFHFVANSDKKTATRLRNTMTSRNLRQSKISRIAELERELEKQKEESELWRRRALEAGWQDGGTG
ncbi:hypothetical protein LTS08_003163 [Lithohypha guttulata]|nr:hypothetical protein LTS08_003163 [Lithohypha guttulata]